MEDLELLPMEASLPIEFNLALTRSKPLVLEVKESLLRFSKSV